MSKFAKPLIFLALMMLSVHLYSLLVVESRPLLGLTSELDYYIVNKGVFAILLLGVVLSAGLRRQAGLVAQVKWRTLPLYWPMALVLGLIWLGSQNPPSVIDAAKILVFCLAVGIGEELMFRGLVFHWFRRLPPRGVVLVSAGSFGAMHLAGLTTEIHPAVILSQAYFAFGVGLVFAGARARDVSILLPIAVHAGFDFLAISAKGSVSQTFENVEQMVSGMLFVGTITLAWGLFLLWRLKGMEETTERRPAHADQLRQVSL
jgi:membrane protease YdiL (CAAX protease family)